MKFFKYWKQIIIGVLLGITFRAIEAEHKQHLGDLKAEEQHKRMDQLGKAYANFTFNESQRELLELHSCLYRHLPHEAKMKVESMAHAFMAEVEFVAVGYEAVTEEMKLVTAVEACLLIMHRGFEDYRRLKRVEFWSHIPDGRENRWAGDCNGQRVRILWPAAQVNSSINYGTNIIIHEFAHVLDYAGDRSFQSIPVPQNSEDAIQWKDLLDREYPRLKAAHQEINSTRAKNEGQSREKHYKRPAISKYAVSNPGRAEFFPEASEVFITNPWALRNYSPELYEQLCMHFGMDPSTWRATLIFR